MLTIHFYFRNVHALSVGDDDSDPYDKMNEILSARAHYFRLSATYFSFLTNKKHKSVFKKFKEWS